MIESIRKPLNVADKPLNLRLQVDIFYALAYVRKYMLKWDDACIYIIYACIHSRDGQLIGFAY